MNRPPLARKKLAGLAVLGVLLTLAAVGWWRRTPLLAWYHVRGLARAPEAERDVWAERVAGLDQAAVPGLVHCLGANDARVCGNARAALARLRERWGKDDPRLGELAGELAGAFGRLSPPGQVAVLQLEAGWLAEAAPPGLVEAAKRLVPGAMHGPGKDVRVGALELAQALAAGTADEDALAKCREAARLGLRDGETEVRVAAVRLARCPELGTLEQVVPGLHDPSAEVRRAAILALGPSRDAIGDEELLPWLHDPDPDVRRLCEVALRGRNIPAEDLRLGKMITDPRHSVRLQAIVELLADPDREPAEWLRRLSHDPTPSVRLAAVRAAAQRPRVDLSDRLVEMTRSDPSPTVCQVIQYYLDCQKRQRSEDPR